MNKKANNVIRISTTLDSRFFKYWFKFLAPFHNLTEREVDVISCLTKHRYELSKVISDPELLDRVVLSEDTRKKVMEECKMTLSYFQVVLGKLRKANVLVDNRINPKFIPNIVEGENSFQLLLLFELK